LLPLYKTQFANLKEINHLGDTYIGRAENTQTDLKETGSKDMDLTSLRQNPMVGSCEQSNEPSGSINGRKFLD